MEDIQVLKKELYKDFSENIKKYIIKYIQAQWNKYLPLFYDKLYGVKNVKYYIYAKPGDNIPYIKWDITANIYFSAVSKEDLKDAFKNYLKERIVSQNEFLSWDETSLDLLNLENITDNLFLATFSINALLWYDFDTDYNWIKEKIIEEVKWKSIQEAKNIILSYPVIAGVEIKTTNTLNKVSDLSSRIFIYITK
jgi:homospermidine synthase